MQSIRVSASVFCTALLALVVVATMGCGEQRQSVFIWDHFLGGGPNPESEPEPGTPEPGQPEPDAGPESAIEFDVERWAVVTGGDPVCARASTRRNAAFMLFTDNQSDLLLELGPGFDLRWDAIIQDPARLRVCTARSFESAQVAVAQFGENFGVVEVVNFDSSGNPGARFPTNFPDSNQFLSPKLMIEVEQGIVAAGRGVSDLGNETPLTAFVTNEGELFVSALRNNALIPEELVGLAVTDEAMFVAFTGRDLGNAGLIVRQHGLAGDGANFPRSEAFLIDASASSIETNLNQNRLAVTENNDIVVSTGNRLFALNERFDVEEITLGTNTRCFSVATSGPSAYVACIQNGLAQVRKVNIEDRDTDVVYQVLPDSDAFDLVKGPNESLVFVWVEQLSNPPVTTIDHLVPR